MLRGRIEGCGAYLPQRVMTNADLERMVETSDSWIRERTGIATRHIAADGETTADLAFHAAQAALADAGLTAGDIDAVLVATSTPDVTMPSTAALVQARLGIQQGFAFDLAAACSGFVYALTTANSLIVAGQAKRVLVIGAETMSRIVDWTDRGTCILFGDGAGAVVLGVTEDADQGLLYSKLSAAGEFAPLLKTSGGVSSTKEAGTLSMAGQEVFRHGVEKMSNAVVEGVNALSLPLTALDLIIAHQANARMLTAIARKLELPAEKFVVALDKHANTSAASIPLALCQAKAEGKVKRGQLIAMPALGAGLTWGCCIIRY